jgi:cysteinyl-tRNA synthetase
MIDQEKMSKSLGNFFTVRDVRAKFSAVSVRLFMLSAHYRSPVNFSRDTLEQASHAQARLRNGWAEIKFALSARPCETVPCEPDAELRESVREARALFDECMEDDFNTAGAIGAVFDVIRATNVSLGREGGLDYETIADAAEFLRTVDGVMGIIGIDEEKRSDDAGIESLINERNESRKNKDYKRSDEIRGILSQKGIILEDTPQGTRWKRAE